MPKSLRLSFTFELKLFPSVSTYENVLMCSNCVFKNALVQFQVENSDGGTKA